jgi:UDP-3-O-[3-hydroxymyristoyl] N-acetylglucosamine deacetylase
MINQNQQIFIKGPVAIVNPKLQTTNRRQRTLKQEAFYSGIGIHTGREVGLRFCPAKEGTGIVFKRVDLPGQPIIPATIEYVQDTSRSTTIGVKEARVHTVEHVLSAVKAYRIDNICIELTNIEPPVGNGSADVFVEMIEKSGISEQNQLIPVVKLQQPIYYSDEKIQIIALPYEGYKISYTLSYADQKFLKQQFHSVIVNEKNFKEEIASCRTFSLFKELSALMDRGLIKGGSLDNAVVITDDAILSKGGLFFENEMARHKILDLIGDLTLVGFDFYAHIISICSGHATNFAFAKKLLAHITMENH